MENKKNGDYKQKAFFRNLLYILWHIYVPAAILSFVGVILFFATIFNGEYETAAYGLLMVVFMIVFHFIIIKRLIKTLKIYDCYVLLKDMIDDPHLYPSYLNFSYLAELLVKKVSSTPINDNFEFEIYEEVRKLTDPSYSANNENLEKETSIVNENDATVISNYSESHDFLNMQKVIEFYKSTISAWSDGKLRKLNGSYEREAKFGFFYFVESYKPIEGGSLFTFFSEYTPYTNEFLVDFGDLSAKKDKDWFILTNKRLIQKDGLDKSFKEIDLTDVETFKVKGLLSAKIVFNMKSGRVVDFKNVRMYPIENILSFAIDLSKNT